MSVKRKVTVPEGNSVIGSPPGPARRAGTRSWWVERPKRREFAGGPSNQKPRDVRTDESTGSARQALARRLEQAPAPAVSDQPRFHAVHHVGEGEAGVEVRDDVGAAPAAPVAGVLADRRRFGGQAVAHAEPQVD